MTTLLDTLTKGAQYLEKKGVDSPRLTMELLVAHVMKMQRMQLYLEFDRPLEEEELESLRGLLKQRGERVPLQHLIGSVEFYGREFKSDARALIPRPETEELVEYVLKLDLPESPRILDLCCGTGVIGLTLQAELGDEAQVTLSDVSEEALSLARENADALGLSVEFVHSDLFQSLSGEYDLIVSNPPYVSTEVELEPELSHDPALALFSGADGLDLIRHLVPQSFERLSSGGVLALEVGYDQGGALQHLMEQAGFTDVRVESDMSQIERFPIGKK